jgi:hypothetical protein
MSAIAQIRHALEQKLSQESGSAPVSITLPSVDAADPHPPAIASLTRLFQLSPFECAILLLCAGVELSKPIASLCAAIQGDAKQTYATFSLALSVFPDVNWAALTPKATLRRWRLIEVGSGTVLTTSPLRIDERILHYLLGIQNLDDRLTGIVSPLSTSPLLDIPLPPSYQALVQDIALSGLTTPQYPSPVIQICGADATTKRAIAAAACAQAGLSLSIITTDALPLDLSQVNLVQCLCEREARLTRTAFLLDCDLLSETVTTDGAIAPLQTVIQRLIEQMDCPLLVSTGDRRPQRQRPLITFTIHPPTPEEQRHLWASLLGEAIATQLNGHIDQLVAHFNLSPAAIQTITTRLYPHLSHPPSHSLPTLLWNTCLAQSRPRLDDLAQPVRSTVDWEDLVLPDKEMAVLQTMTAHVRQRSAVYDRWGFAKKSRRGLGISALFAGVSGTGKTLAAEVMANALHLDLYRIDLSSVVSKYIGETEKNLRRIFDAAETGGAVLLFDEADALFGKRSDVKDSHDRYANMEVAYLLQRVESYRGLAILTTNLKDSIDQAFLRRIRFVVQFPFPDADQREAIWQRAFPAETPTQELNYKKLAKLSVAGGNIRNIALNAAFLAADAGEPVQMKHILQAAQSEYIKLERPLTEREVKGWVSPEI